MQLPALKNAIPASLVDGMTVEEFIRNSTQNLQRAASASGGNGGGVSAYRGFDGHTGHWKLNREPVTPEDVGRLLIPQNAMYEGCIEWANGTPLQKVQRQLLGVHYDAPMSEQLLPKPLSPGAYKKTYDGPTLTMGFIGFMLDDGSTVGFEHSSNGGKKAVNALGTAATQALVAFGELVHPVVELGSGSYEATHGTVYDPKFKVIGYVTDKRAREADVIADADIITRPTASKAKQRRTASEAPAI
jgi:hypothetical protein